MEKNNIFKLSYFSENHEKLLSFVRAIGLENPTGSLFCCLGEQVRFSGWVLPLDTEVSVEWIVKDGDKTVASYLPSIRRKDVQQHYSISCNEHVKHGFDFLLVGGNFDRVCLRLNEVEIQVFGVSMVDILNTKRLTDAAIEFCNFHENIRNDCHEVGVKSGIGIYDLLPSDFKVLDAREFLDWYSVKFGSVSRVEDVIRNFRVPDWSISFMVDGVSSGNFSVPGVLSGGVVNCRFGVVVGDFNYLFFSSGDECFYLVQHCANVCLVFPEYMLVVGFSEVGPWVNTARDKLPELYRQVRRDINVAASKESGNFLGLCLTHSRPYHYIYDYLFGMNVLLSRTDVMFDIYGVAGFDFFDVNFFENCNSYESLLNEQLNKKCLSMGGFLVMPCVQYIYSDFDRGLPDLASKLIRLSNKLCATRFSSLYALDADLIIWVGVSNEKRSWIEQVDGFANIIRELSFVFNRVSVFVDGRTFPIFPCGADVANKNREDKLFDELVLRCPGVSFFNMIGLQAIEKIYLAQKIDFFISSYSTDSIYPSAICRKPGVVYAAPSIGDQRYLHIHHEIIEVPGDKVKEVEPSDSVSRAWHETSISMDWRDLFGCVQRILDEHGVKK